MKIIMLSGKHNSGKSTTLNLVYDKMEPNIETIIEPKKVLGNPIYKDFECIVKYNNKKVAFYTMGDFSGLLIDAFKKYDNLNCCILICACSTKFSTPYREITNYQHNVVKKTMPLCDESNESDRDEILRLLDE
jgi:hypothetical protein